MAVVALLVARAGARAGAGRALPALARRASCASTPTPRRAGLRQVGERLEELIADRALLKRVLLWASLNWLLDAASLWVFLRAFGGSLEIDALLVAFGLANIFAVIPLTPGGLGIVEGVYIPTLVGFGLTRRAGHARRRLVPVGAVSGSPS